MIEWYSENDNVYAMTPDSIDANDGYGMAVYNAGAFPAWYFNVWNERNPGDVIYDSFDELGGSHKSAETAKQVAETWLNVYLSYMNDVK